LWNEYIRTNVFHRTSWVMVLRAIFSFCVAFFVGDELQQRMQAGIHECNWTYTCIYCTHSSKDGLYYERRHVRAILKKIINFVLIMIRFLQRNALGI